MKFHRLIHKKDNWAICSIKGIDDIALLHRCPRHIGYIGRFFDWLIGDFCYSAYGFHTHGRCFDCKERPSEYIVTTYHLLSSHLLASKYPRVLYPGDFITFYRYLDPDLPKPLLKFYSIGVVSRDVDPY